MRKKELQKYVMLDRQKNSGKRDKKESEWILSCLLIHVDERVFPKTLYNVIIVHLLSLLQWSLPDITKLSKNIPFSNRKKIYKKWKIWDGYLLLFFVFLQWNTIYSRL